MRPLQWLGRLVEAIHDRWVLRRSLRAGKEQAISDGDADPPFGVLAWGDGHETPFRMLGWTRLDAFGNVVARGEWAGTWPERACRECGCTDLAACDPPCHWVEADLCSGCG